MISMVDLLGKRFWTKQLDLSIGSQDNIIPTEGLPSGIYFVHLDYEDYSKNLKLQVISRP